MKLKNIKCIIICFFIILGVIQSGIYGIAYIMKDKAENKNNREICRQVLDSSKQFINLISDKTVGKKIFKVNNIKNNIDINEILRNQEIIEKQIEREYSEFEYTWRNPYIKVNPYGTTPLSALIKFKTDEPMKVKIEIVDREGTNIAYEFNEYNIEHEYEISGLYLKGKTELIITLLDQNNVMKSKKIEIGHKYKLNTKENIVVLTNHLKNNSLYLLRSYSKILYIDNFGKIRGIKIGIAFDDSIILKNNKYLNFYFNNKIVTIENEIGKIIKVYNLDKYSYHHHAIELDNGNILLAVNKEGAIKVGKDKKNIKTVEDHIIELDRESGKIIKEWDIGDILDVNRLYQGRGKSSDWFHMNSFIYDKQDNSLIISGNHQGVIKIDYETGKLKWIMAYHKEWGRAGRDGKGEDLNKYLLFAVDRDGNRYPEKVQNGDIKIDEFEFPVGQHDLSFVGENQILMFNNRRLSAPVLKNSPKKYSEAIIYEIDEKNMAVKEVWNFGRELGEDMYSSVVSSVEKIDNSILIGAGAIENSNGDNGRIIQVNQETKKIELDILYFTSSTSWNMNFYQINKLKN